MSHFSDFQLVILTLMQFISTSRQSPIFSVSEIFIDEMTECINQKHRVTCSYRYTHFSKSLTQDRKPFFRIHIHLTNKQTYLKILLLSILLFSLKWLLNFVLAILSITFLNKSRNANQRMTMKHRLIPLNIRYYQHYIQTVIKLWTCQQAYLYVTEANKQVNKNKLEYLLFPHHPKTISPTLDNLGHLPEQQ